MSSSVIMVKFLVSSKKMRLVPGWFVSGQVYGEDSKTRKSSNFDLLVKV